MPALAAADLVGRMGGALPARLGIDLQEGSDDAALGRWLVGAVLLGGRGDEAKAEAAWRALAEEKLADPVVLAEANPLHVATRLASAGLPGADLHAMVLVRASRTLAEHHAGSLAALAAEAEGLEDLAGHIAALAPGIGRATVAAFLRPLRDVWRSADEVPLSRAARAAAVDLGWIADHEDAEGAPGALRAALARANASEPLADVEAALGRLGRAACLRGELERCPLDALCPLRSDRT